MSILAMNWAWKIQLQPTQKLVLMSLADSSDESGISWPSVLTVAKKCSISPRTAQRIISSLREHGFIHSRARYRADGSRTSNLYYLSIDSGTVNVPPSVVKPGSPECHVCVAPHVSDDSVTTKNQNIKPPPPTVVLDSSCGDFIFSQKLSKNQIENIKKKLIDIDKKIGQQILDELAGRMQISEVRNPLRYCSTLIERAISNQFSPELGIKVGEIRQIVAEREEHLKESVKTKVDRKLQPVGNPRNHLKDALAILKKNKNSSFK